MWEIVTSIVNLCRRYLQSPTLVCPFFLQCTASKTNDSTEQNLSGNSCSLFSFLLIGWFFLLTQVAGPSGLKMKTGALWDEVVDCIVLGSYPILEITIQSTVFPTVVHFPSNMLCSDSCSVCAVLHSGMFNQAMCPVPFGDHHSVIPRENT